jgi:glycosyltransferase involved in cell wall biosynthesis
MAVAPKRIDLHCHSDASNKTSEAALNAIHCPESYSRPQEVYAQARRRGMDFVTITDHDSIEGVAEIAHQDDVIVGEELTCWFPEDHCKMHVLVYGITPEDHGILQSRARNIYDVAEYIERNRLAHSVAHPIYRQNDKLERWHLERLLLLFKGFECLNGAHSALHREAFEPLLDRLTREEIARLSEVHGLLPRWPEPWHKARTAGTDDHGLLNVGRTYTEFPPETATKQDILNCLRIGRCQPAGEAGSSAKLAHTFYSVAVRYYSRHILAPGAKPNLATTILQTLAGEKPAPSKATLAKLALKSKVKKLGRKLVSPFVNTAPTDSQGSGIIRKLFLQSAKARMNEFPDLWKVALEGLPPLGEHERMFEFVSKVNADVTRGIAEAIETSVDHASFTGLFDSIAAILAQEFVMMPYYFCVFHQNKERQLLRRITGQKDTRTPDQLKVGLFVDTFDEVNGVARFVRDIGELATSQGRQLTVHTCSAKDGKSFPFRRNFAPTLTRPMPFYPELGMNLPPVLEILEWADRMQFDAIHVSTPGPMGLLGWLVAKMLRVPMLMTHHTDFPAYLDRFTGDHRVTNGTIAYLKWFYSQAQCVFSRSSAYRFKLMDLGVPESRIRVLEPGINLSRFSPKQPLRKEGKQLLYVGRVSVEKNLPLLVEIMKDLARRGRQVELVVAGDGPYRKPMEEALSGLPVRFLGYCSDEQLPGIYSNADLLVFPSTTDTLGQTVMEAQACGLPAVVSNKGGPRELIIDDETGVVVDSTKPEDWATVIESLLNAPERLDLMSAAATQHAGRFSLQRTFDVFWAEHASRILQNEEHPTPSLAPPAMI